MNASVNSFLHFLVIVILTGLNPISELVVHRIN